MIRDFPDRVCIYLLIYWLSDNKFKADTSD